MASSEDRAHDAPWQKWVLGLVAVGGAGALFGLAVWLTLERPGLALARAWMPKRHDALLGRMELYMVVGAGLAAVAAVVWARAARSPDRLMRLAAGLGVAGGIAFALRVLTGPSTVVPMVVLAAACALAAGLALGPVVHGLVSRRPAVAHTVAVWAPLLFAFVIYCVWSVTRHQWFGTGSWDMGCYNHNIWLLGHGKPPISTVLGDAHIFGDHFMPLMYLLAPLSWAGSTWLLLVVQAALVTGAALPLAALARHAGLGPGAVFGVCVAFLFAVGTQSMLNFDFHEVAPVPLGLLMAVLGFHTNRRWLAYGGLILLFICKESAILYAGGVGGWLMLTRPGRRLEGFGIAAFCLVSFWIVVGHIQPWLTSLAPAQWAHFDRYAAFGSSLSEALTNIVRHPGKALVVFVTPERKTETLLFTFGGFGFLPLLSPGALWMTLPNLVERFLSDKREMWGLGYHYSVMLLSASAYATTQTLGRVAKHLAVRRARHDGSGPLSRLAHPGVLDVAAAVFLTLTTVGAMRVLPGEYDLEKLYKPYFSTSDGARINHRAVAFIPDDARVVAQNHFLPHLAFREHIWQPQLKFISRADYIVLNPRESPWPHDRKHVVRLVTRLLDDGKWSVAFSEGTTVIFSQLEVDVVEPTPALLDAVGR